MFYREKRWKKHFFYAKTKNNRDFLNNIGIFLLYLRCAYRIGMIAPGRERGLQAVERILQLG